MPAARGATHNVAIVGAGLISSLHIEAYQKLSPRARIAAIVDVDQDKAEAQRARYGLEARCESDYRRLLDDAAIDLVSVCVPPAAHADVAETLLAAGKHVLLEKPMAPSLAECDRIDQAARRAGRLISVVTQKRFEDEVFHAKTIVERGLIGRVLHGQADSYWWRGDAYYDVPWRGNWKTEGGGCVFIHAVHHLDLLQWFMGMPVSVSAVVANVGHPSSEAEDIAVATLEYPSGVLAQLNASLVHHGERQGLSFQGERASVALPWSVRANASRKDGFPQDAPEVERELGETVEGLEPLRFTGHAGQIADLFDAIEADSQPMCDATQGRNAIELITAIYASAAEKAPVALPLGIDHAFYAPGATQRAMAEFMRGRRA